MLGRKSPKLPPYDRSKAAGEREIGQGIARGLDTPDRLGFTMTFAQLTSPTPLSPPPKGHPSPFRPLWNNEKLLFDAHSFIGLETQV